MTFGDWRTKSVVAFRHKNFPESLVVVYNFLVQSTEKNSGKNKTYEKVAWSFIILIGPMSQLEIVIYFEYLSMSSALVPSFHGLFPQLKWCFI